MNAKRHRLDYQPCIFLLFLYASLCSIADNSVDGIAAAAAAVPPGFVRTDNLWSTSLSSKSRKA